jgi:Cleft lip and palate transmembrane protein 1 (CLPTM1)
MDDAFKRQAETPNPLGQTSGAEVDEFKKMLIDTNPILLFTTFFVRPLLLLLT